MKLFDSQELLATVRARTNLSDFGDPRLLEGFEFFVKGLNETDNIIPGREEALREMLLKMLSNLLWRNKDFVEHPEILEEPLAPAVCIVSLPRVGTTKIQRMLGATSVVLSVPYWYLHMPSRIPGLPECGKTARIAITEEFCRWREAVSPTINVTHRSFTLEPDEDAFLQNHSFCTGYLAQTHNLSVYNEWFQAQDLSFPYAFERQQLQYLQWQFHRFDPKPWLLKSPGHLGAEDLLLKTFPEGCRFICPHREPAEIFPSALRLGEDFAKLYNSLPWPLDEFAWLVVEGMCQQMERHMIWRDQNPEIEVLDLSFSEVCNDSIGTAEKIYAFLGLPLSEDDKQQIMAWESENPRHKDGRLDLSLEQYGLDEHSVNKKFENYRQVFKEFLT